MEFSLAGYSSLGRRKNNEDAYLVLETARGLLAAVADGLGGQENGEYASQQAVQTLRSRLSSPEVSSAAFRDAILQASDDITALQDEHPYAMTTIAAVWIDDNHALAMHTGDSRIYHFRSGQILYQSTDNSVSQAAVSAGEITLEDIRFHRDRNKLTQVLGDAESPEITEHALDLAPGDRLLLCSDGFWEKIWESEMLTAADTTQTAEEWLSEMRRTAEPAASDNNTAVAVIITG